MIREGSSCWIQGNNRKGSDEAKVTKAKITQSAQTTACRSLPVKYRYRPAVRVSNGWADRSMQVATYETQVATCDDDFEFVFISSNENLKEKH